MKFAGFAPTGIKKKLSILTMLMILCTLLVTLTISSAREIAFKKAEARKLMINVGKQIALIKGLGPALTPDLVTQYLTQSVHAAFSRKGYSISIVYIFSTDKTGRADSTVFNWDILDAPRGSAGRLVESIIADEALPRETSSPSMPGVQHVTLDLSDLGKLFVGFSISILKEEIIRGILAHLVLGLALMSIGIAAAIWIANRITRPLFLLIAGFQKIVRGDFDVRVQISTGDEIEQLGKSFNHMAAGLKEREMIKDVFRRYATDQVVQKILQGEMQATLTGQRRKVTVLFSDIRMFTGIASRLSPEAVVRLLNIYFTAMTDIAIESEGFIDKFTGDEMMVVYGAPIQHPDDARRALLTARRMLLALNDVNVALESEGFPRIDIGIGISTGPAIAGNIGSEKRMAYTVIGQDVNLAARLVSIAQRGEICISEATYEEVRDLAGGAVPDTVALKGLDKPLTVYRLRPESGI